MEKTIQYEGILPVFKPHSCPSFSLITLLRKITNIKKIGHAGTLDPFAEGLMILLIGRQYTKVANHFLNQEKEYIATLTLGQATNTFDKEGQYTQESTYVPTSQQVQSVVEKYQGYMMQIPPMFSAKKINGKRLYELARKGVEVPREPKQIYVETKLLAYNYPNLQLQFRCSKGTYIRSLANDIGVDLQSFAHLTKLIRTKNGPFTLKDCIKITSAEIPAETILPYLCKSIPI